MSSNTFYYYWNTIYWNIFLTLKSRLRACRLNQEENVQMVTALVLQLIQCIIKLPEKTDDEEEDSAAHDVIIATSYEQAMKTAHHFLSVFLKKLVL